MYLRVSDTKFVSETLRVYGNILCSTLAMGRIGRLFPRNNCFRIHKFSVPKIYYSTPIFVEKVIFLFLKTSGYPSPTLGERDIINT